MADLLPISIRDARTEALAGLLDRFDALPLVAILGHLYDPANCSSAALPHLAAQWGVLSGAWALAKTEAEQRALVGKALLLQRHRGTPWALAQVLTSVGWPGGVFDERIAANHDHQGTSDHDGSIRYGGLGGWATYRVRYDLGSRTLAPSDVALIRSAVAAWGPVGRRCCEVQLRLQLSGGLVVGKTAADAASLEVGGVPVGLLEVDGSLVSVRIRGWELPAADLRAFVLKTSGGATVATATRNLALVKGDAVILVEWSL